MLLVKTITKTEDVQIEIKTPAFFSKENSEKKVMLCNDGSIIMVWGHYLNKYIADLSYSYKSTLEETLQMDPSNEDAFMKAYEDALKSFESAMFPEAKTV